MPTKGGKPRPKPAPPGPLLLVLPFYSGDAWLLEKNLHWMRELDEKLDFDAVLSTDTDTDPAKVHAIALKLFKSVTVIRYKRMFKTEWPHPQNHAFTSTAWAMVPRNRSWLWMETDAVPMRSRWLHDIADEHEKAKRPFTGHWSETSNVFNGVGVYPANVSLYSRKAMTATLYDGNQPPWDVFCSPEVERHLNKANHLFQHMWHDEKTGKAYTFPTMDAVRAVVRKKIAVFHRCKDASLVLRLHEQNQKGISRDLRWTI